jgi:hypothetical protein
VWAWIETRLSLFLLQKIPAVGYSVVSLFFEIEKMIRFSSGLLLN